MSYNYEPGINFLWELSPTYTVIQAAALVAGYDPEVISRCCNDTNFGQNFPGFYTANVMLANAIECRSLKATIRHFAKPRHVAGIDNLIERGHWQGGPVLEVVQDDESFVVNKAPSWELTTITRSDLVEWLRGQGMRTGFFFPDEIDTPNYLDPNHPRHSKKLAAAVLVWQAMDDDNLLSGKAPKIAMEEWLAVKYKELGLTWQDGKSNQAISDVAAIANWHKAGPAKTPGS